MKEISLKLKNYYNDPAIISGKVELTYREFFESVLKAAEWVKEQGVRPGETVGMLGEPSIGYIALLLGLISAGAVAGPLSTRLKDGRIPEYLQTINARKLLLFNRDTKLKNSPDFTIIKASGFKWPGPEKNRDRSGDIEIFSGDFNRPATVIFTSGSSGTPRGAVLTLANHFYSAAGSNQNIPFGPGDRYLLTLPLYHVGGLAVLFRAMLGGGAVVAAPSKKIPENIRRYQITHISLVSTQLYRLLDEGFSGKNVKSLKSVLLGGGPLPDKMIREAVKRGLPLNCTYGCTEMASQVTTTRPGAPVEELLTAGKTLPYREIKIDPDKEILVRGKTLFSGYFEAGKIRKACRADGWFDTGDLGKVDSFGNLSVIGRKDNMFISGGENIQPEEIEKALLMLDSIEQALVVPIADREFGARPAVFIKHHPNTQWNTTEIRANLQSLLPGYKIPVKFFPWPEAADAAGFKPSRKEFLRIAQNLLRKEEF